jgi:hypothetical protein
MSAEQAYINGFVKRASKCGFDENQAFYLLKQAVNLQGLAKGYQAFKNSGASKWIGRGLTGLGVAGYGTKAVDAAKNRINAGDYTGAAVDATTNTLDAVGTAYPAVGKVVGPGNRYLKTFQNNRDQVRGYQAGTSSIGKALHPQENADVAAIHPNIGRLGRPVLGTQNPYITNKLIGKDIDDSPLLATLSQQHQ